MNQMQAQAMDRAGETGEPIFRTPCSVGSGETPSILEVLEECLRWHQGDKWREGNPARRAAWEAHERMLANAIAAETHRPRSLLRKVGEPLVCYCPPDKCQAPTGFRGPCNRAAIAAATEGAVS